MFKIPIALAEEQASETKPPHTRAMTAMAAILAASLVAIGAAAPAVAQQKQPNILFIMGDDVGWFNIGAYHQGIMSGKTPNLDRLASEGCASPTIMPKRAAPPVAPISSLANCRSGPG